MKNIFTSLFLAFGILSFAQDAGKAGELLKNEASKTEMQKKVDLGNGIAEDSYSSGADKRSSTNNKGGNNPNYGTPNNGGFRPPQPSYHWNQNYGYAEVFLRIPEMGYFSVQIGNQVISNALGKFRFFDLNAGSMPISIFQNGYLVYKTQLTVRNNTRLVLDFFSRYGLYLLDSYPVQGQMYGINQWDDVWNNPYANNPYPNGNNGYGNGKNIMDDRNFASFMEAMKRNNFDDGRINFVKSQLKNSNFTSQQIAIMMKSLSFDRNRLILGKMLYPICVDKQNFFQVYSSLDFDSSRNELMNFVSRN